MTNTIATFKPLNINIKDNNFKANLLQQAENQPYLVEGKIGELIKNIRHKTANNVVTTNFPDTKQEDWRFTDLSELQTQDLSIANKETIDDFTLNGFILPEAINTRLVFVNGIYAPELSDISSIPQGIYVGNLSKLPQFLNEKISKFLINNQPENEFFTNLNSAGINDYAIIYAEKNIEFKTPIHLLNLTVRNKYNSFSQPRILIIAEDNSNLNIVEYYGAVTKGCSDSARQQYYFNNVVTEIYLQDNTTINHSRIQRESGDGFHIAKTSVNQMANSNYTINEISLGGKFYRHNLHIQQQGIQTETTLNGFTMVQGKQFADTHSIVNLSQPHGTIKQLHKYILDDSARGVFNGKIYVPKNAQLTNASQLNRNLLLSSKARINTKPELQITADNVKCSHGATVSQLEADEIFYLRSRGLNEYDARHLLLDAFAGEMLDKLPLKSLQQRLTQCVACRTLD